MTNEAHRQVMAAAAGKYLIRNEITASAGRSEHVEEGAYPMKANGHAHQQAHGARLPPKLLDCNGLPKTYAGKAGATKESKELKAHRKKLLQAFTLK
jgi:hypothetical protein